MKPLSLGVSKTHSSVNKKGRRYSLPIQELINRLNTSLHIREPSRHHSQSQTSILQFVTSNKNPDSVTHPSQGISLHQPNAVSDNLVVVPMSGVVFQEPEKTLVTVSMQIQPTAQINPIGILPSEKFSLLDRINPIMPESLTTTMDGYAARDAYADGFAHIDQLSAMDCVLSPFQAMEEVPKQHQEVFASAMEKILTRVWENQTEGIELDRALKWWFFLPQCLLRKATRGGRAGMSLVKKRFDCVINEDYGQLINIWIRDRDIASKKNLKARNPTISDRSENKTRQAVNLISRGFISKATNRITSHGVASLKDPQSKAALQSKYPDRGRDMPVQLTKGLAVESMISLREAFLALKGGVAPGTGQLRPEFLTTLAEVWEVGTNVWELVNNFAMRHIQGQFPPWYYKACMTVETVGLYKTANQEASQVRPVGMRNPWIKTMHKEVVKENKEILTDFWSFSNLECH